MADLGAVRHGFAPPGDEPPADPDMVPLADLLRGTMDDVQAALAGERALLHARADLAFAGLRVAAVWGAVAAITASVAVLALAFGAILTLAPVLGPLGATLLVVLALLVVAVIGGRLAWRGTQNIRRAIGASPSLDGDGTDGGDERRDADHD